MEWEFSEKEEIERELKQIEQVQSFNHPRRISQIAYGVTLRGEDGKGFRCARLEIRKWTEIGDYRLEKWNEL